MSRLDSWTRRRLVPNHSIESGDFVRFIQAYKHPRLAAIGIISHTSPQATGPRASKGIRDRHGTVWVQERPFGDREFLNSVVCGAIPYKGNGKEIAWDEQWERYVYKQDRMKPASPVVGWKDILHDLLKGGYIRPSHFLSGLLGFHTFDMMQKSEWRIL